MPKLRRTCISLSIVDIGKQNAPADVMDKKDYFIRLTLSLSLSLTRDDNYTYIIRRFAGESLSVTFVSYFLVAAEKIYIMVTWE